LLVPHKNVADVVIVDGVIEGKGHPSGIAEEAIDAFTNQTFQHDTRAVHQS
jgi:hypothetical protein